MKFRKKPVVIEAIQWDGSAKAQIQIEEWVGDGIQADFTKPGTPIIIPTLEGDHQGKLGDWIIKGVKDEVYPCKPDIFEQTYEPVED
jgi:hypothetical protein